MKLLRVMVRSSGELFVDGRLCSPSDFKIAIEALEGEPVTVWYHREKSTAQCSADESGPQELSETAAQVLAIITEHKLPIRLCAEPDFSDCAASVQHTLHGIFASIRDKASQGHIVILGMEGRVLSLPALRNVTPEMLAMIEKILPASTKRNVAVMADTSWAKAALSIAVADEAIPFFGLLIGFCCAGHTVWIFDPKGLAIVSTGCQDADVVIVDQACLPRLPAGWEAIARAVMRNRQILVHDRQTNQLRKAK